MDEQTTPQPNPSAKSDEERANDERIAREVVRRASALVDMKGHIDTLTGEVADLTNELETLEDERKTDRNRFYIMTSLLIVALLIVGSIAFSNRRNGQILVNCTTPGPRTPTIENPRTGHDCYDDGQARTGKAVAAIVCENARDNRAVVQAAIPGIVLPDPPAICMTE